MKTKLLIKFRDQNNIKDANTEWERGRDGISCAGEEWFHGLLAGWPSVRWIDI